MRLIYKDNAGNRLIYINNGRNAFIYKSNATDIRSCFFINRQNRAMRLNMSSATILQEGEQSSLYLCTTIFIST